MLYFIDLLSCLSYGSASQVYIYLKEYKMLDLVINKLTNFTREISQKPTYQTLNLHIAILKLFHQLILQKEKHVNKQMLSCFYSILLSIQDVFNIAKDSSHTYPNSFRKMCKLISLSINCLQSLSEDDEMLSQQLINRFHSANIFQHSVISEPTAKKLLYIETQIKDYSVTLSLIKTVRSLIINTKQQENTLRSNFFNCSLSYLQNEIFSSFITWEYKKKEQKWEIGLEILKLFDLVVSHVELKIANHYSIENSLKNSLIKNVLNESSYHRAVLLKIVEMGPWEIENKYKSQRYNEAKLIEKLSRRSLKILNKILLAREFNKETKVTELEFAIINTVESSLFQNKFINLVFVIASFIKESFNTYTSAKMKNKISINATRVLINLFQLTNGSLISILGFLANKVHIIKDSCIKIIKDPSKNPKLRSELLNMIQKALYTQPGLASEFIYFKETPGENDLLYWILNKILNSREHFILTHAIEVIESIWKNYPNYLLMVKKLKNIQIENKHQNNNVGFWDILGKALKDFYPREQENLVEKCQAKSIQSSILNIFSLEIFHNKNKQLDNTFLRIISSYKNEILKWIDIFADEINLPQHKYEVERLARNENINIVRLQRTGKFKNFGSNFVYQISLAKKVTSNLQFIQSLEKANEEFSIFESKRNALNSLKNFVEICGYSKMVELFDKTPKSTEIIVASLTQKIKKFLGNEQKNSEKMKSFYEIRILVLKDLFDLLFLVLNKCKPLKFSKEKFYLELIDMLCNNFKSLSLSYKQLLEMKKEIISNNNTSSSSSSFSITSSSSSLGIKNYKKIESEISIISSIKNLLMSSLFIVLQSKKNFGEVLEITELLSPAIPFIFDSICEEEELNFSCVSLLTLIAQNTPKSDSLLFLYEENSSQFSLLIETLQKLLSTPSNNKDNLHGSLHSSVNEQNNFFEDNSRNRGNFDENFDENFSIDHKPEIMQIQTKRAKEAFTLLNLILSFSTIKPTAKCLVDEGLFKK